jgi:hypothetical protein
MLVADQSVLDYRRNPTDHSAISKRFANGDYVGVALQGTPSQWEYHAAVGLIRNPASGLAGLARFDNDPARFWTAVLHWMNGDELSACDLLGKLEGEHALNLLRLIRKPQIDVLVRLPPTRDGPFVLLDGIERDPKFRVRNLGFQSGDLPFAPYQSIHDFYARATPPDFFVVCMVEWHAIPTDLHELPCATIGHTSDFDVHIQGTAQWLRAFDHILLADHVVEWPIVSRIADVPCHAYPMVFGVAKNMPPLPIGQRKIDVFMSGSMISAYQPDKALLTNQLLRMDDLNTLLVNGHLGWDDYYQLVGRSKIVPTFCRHTGGLLTRAIEALAMGCVALLQKDSMHTLWSDESTGLFLFDEQEGPEPVIRRILADYDRIAAGCIANVPAIRQAFSPATIASRYFRFCTVIAAAPRKPRGSARFEVLTQKRNIFTRGPLPPMDLALKVASANVERMEVLNRTHPSAALRNDQARELMLLHGQRAYFDASYQDDSGYAYAAAARFRVGIQEYPDNLVLRFNLMRLLVHLGITEAIQEGLDIARAILAHDADDWQIGPDDDVMPYDLLPQFFDYRAYLDVVVHAMATGEDMARQMRDLVLASVHAYVAVICDDPRHADEAVRLAPTFPYYALWLAERLLSTQAGDAVRAVSLLLPVARDSVVAYRAWRALLLAEERLGHGLRDVEALDPTFTQAQRSFVQTEHHEIRLRSPYYRASQLRRLAQHGPLIQKNAHKSTARVSIVVTSVGGAGLNATLRSLRSPWIADTCEVIAVECFGRLSLETLDLVDVAITCDQPEFVEHRAMAENQALALLGGRIAVFVQAGTRVGPETVANLVAAIEGANGVGRRLALLAQMEPGAPPILAAATNDVREVGGFDEAEPFYAGTLHHEQLLSRMVGDGVVAWTRDIDGAQRLFEGVEPALRRCRTPATAEFVARQWPSCFAAPDVVRRLRDIAAMLIPLEPAASGATVRSAVAQTHVEPDRVVEPSGDLVAGPPDVQPMDIEIPQSVRALHGLNRVVAYCITGAAVLIGRFCFTWVREVTLSPRSPFHAMGRVLLPGLRRTVRRGASGGLTRYGGRRRPRALEPSRQRPSGRRVLIDALRGRLFYALRGAARAYLSDRAYRFIGDRWNRWRRNRHKYSFKALRRSFAFWVSLSTSRLVVSVGRLCVAWVREMEACPRPFYVIGRSLVRVVSPRRGNR